MIRREGMPHDTVEAAVAWKKSREAKREATIRAAQQESAAPEEEEPTAEIPVVAAAEISKTGDSLLDALNNAIIAEEGAFGDYQTARVMHLKNRAARLSEHNKALEMRFKAETAYRVELERRGVLVNKDLLIEKCRRCMEAMLRRLKKLPGESGPQCNEVEPLKAVSILERAVNEIMATGVKELDDLES